MTADRPTARLDELAERLGTEPRDAAWFDYWPEDRRRDQIEYDRLLARLRRSAGR